MSCLTRSATHTLVSTSIALGLFTAIAARAEGLQPDAAYAQLGEGAHATQSLTVGATWDWSWHWPVAGGAVDGYWDLALARWHTHQALEGDPANVTQIGFTPVFRFRGDAGRSRWFLEAGIGANVIAPHYAAAGRHFGSNFNFGDQLGIGIDLGDRRQHQIALHIQHFSNAGIQEPNPGENFVQLRYAYRF